MSRDDRELSSRREVGSEGGGVAETKRIAENVGEHEKLVEKSLQEVRMRVQLACA